MSELLVVLDTNVVVAGLLTRDREAPTARQLDLALAGRLRLLLSPELLAEYREVLLRPKIMARHRLEPSEIDEILTDLAWHAAVREPPAAAEPAPPDPDDAHLWALLAAEPEAFLVSGDEALVRASPTRVVTPTVAVQRVSNAVEPD